jgi:hypothetical protein
VTPSSSLKPPVTSAEALHDSSVAYSRPFRLRGRNRVLFFLTAWLIVLMPFLFWWGTWFGRPLSDKQIGEYLNDEKHPRHIQHALVQLGDRIARQDPAAKRWYPDIARLARHPVEEVRNTDAWVMGQDKSSQAFHEALLQMLQDPAITVRGNAALSLVRFGDSSGRAQIVALLQPARITAPVAGRVLDIGKEGTSVHQGGLIAKLQVEQRTIEVRSPIRGRLHKPSTSPGTIVSQGVELSVVIPPEEQVWEALRALFLVGQPEDLPAIRIYERELRDGSNRARQQAVLTEQAILQRARQQP